MEERRLLLAVALSLLVLTAYQLLFPPPPPPRGAATTPAAPATPAASPPAPQRPQPGTAALASAGVREPAVADELERRVEVVGADIVVAFTNRGARVLTWQLNRYRDAKGRPEDMVRALPEGPRPLDFETGDPAVDERLRGALFRPSSESLRLRPGGASELRFDYSDGELVAEKTLSFPERGYLARVGGRVRLAGNELPLRLLWGPGIGNPTAAETEVRGYVGPSGVVLEHAVRLLTAEELASPARFADARWLGVESRYFAALFVPPGGHGGGELRVVSQPSAEGGKVHALPVALVGLEAGAPAQLYVGPKDYHILSGLGQGLNGVVPIGDWIGPLVVPLLSLLRFVHTYVGNYGWSIVALTVLINLAMGPLRHYSIANGLKMAKLSPEMKVIQERYRKVPALDPRRQEMQKEIQALYERHGMSMGTQMAVGCLPILLTMPFLFAFYRVLDVSIDLRGADFLWIGDLSQKDPLFLTPLLMGVSMFVMQRMTPSTMDPAQQRVMMLMPLMLVGMFFWAPAGLNLYWLVSNLCSIVQQGVTQRMLRQEARAPAKEKRRK